MHLSPDEIRSAAMTLPAEVRARLAHELLLSLDAATEEEGVDAAWAAEVELRARKVLSGDYEARDWKESLDRIQARLDGRR